MKVRLTHRAEADLEHIADFTARDNPSRAKTFIEELYERCITLGDMPQAFPLIPRYETFGVRRRPHGDYLILYTVAGETVTVLRVLHGARDYVHLLFPE